MTRKEYLAIAESLRNEYASTTKSLAEVSLLQRLIPAIGAAISRNGGLDANGNRRFTTSRFCCDAGFHWELAERYHGQDPMYPGDTRLTNPYTPPTWSDMLGETKQA